MAFVVFVVAALLTAPVSGAKEEVAPAAEVAISDANVALPGTETATGLAKERELLSPVTCTTPQGLVQCPLGYQCVQNVGCQQAVPVQQPVPISHPTFWQKHKGKLMALMILVGMVLICCVLPLFCMKEAYECIFGPGSYMDPSGDGYGGAEMAAMAAAAGAAGYYMGNQGGQPGYQNFQQQQMY